ncbi:AcrB/AcrD/AcrF family protein [Spiribacter sp. C176]|uniref:AcrB/AcrD/AcrF family protein n=1 Tax=Spiribacter salilacus TaxID=2664894 RepID=A0A6N7QSN7_9GAMM|nr:efflux RND transporter permease subunit [Spiribacter salilacus]MRH77327.1 AcrB/AcrD/AcrF family protein [Spiribacter salilacus]
MKPSPRGLPAIGIQRPILITVINLLIAIAGLAALAGVEVREIPDVDRPVLTVSAQFPGAAPETMDAEVTSRIEGAVARVSGVRSINASSEEGSTRVVVEFYPNVDLDSAASEVREAISRIERNLPNDLDRLTVIKADQNASPVARVAVQAPQLTLDELTRRVETDIVPELISISGVADVRLFGNRPRQLRVSIDPLRLAAHQLDPTDVIDALKNADLDVPAGSFRGSGLELRVRANAAITSAEQLKAIEIRPGLALREVATAILAPADARSEVQLNGETILGLGIIRQAQSNTLEISSGLDAAIERLNARLDDIVLIKTSDEARFVRSAIQEVLITLTAAIGIVVLVIWLFIGTIRATIIPAVTIPLALTGTLTAIWLLGFSVNLLTLLALVLATGLVVDDAIVVLENIQRRRREGLEPNIAALLGTHQVFFAVIATTAVLIAVFVPISLLPGDAGRLFREFGVILGVAVAISSFTALSLVPAMAARVIKSDPPPGRLRRNLQRLGNRIAHGYARSLGYLIKRPVVIVVAAALVLGSAIWIYQGIDQELLPTEDRSLTFVVATGPDGAGLKYSDLQARRMQDRLQPLVDSGEIARLFTIVGRWDPNRILIVAPLVDWDDRTRHQTEIINDMRAALADLPGVQIRVGSTNSLRLRGIGSGLEIALLGDDYDEIYAAAQDFTTLIEDRLPQLSQPRISYSPTQPQLRVDIDRQRATELGVPLDGLGNIVQAMVSGFEVVNIDMKDQSIPIRVEPLQGLIENPADLRNLRIRADSGAMVPLLSVVSFREESVAAELDRRAQRRAIDIDLAIDDNYTMQQAIEDLSTLARETLPSNISMIPLGEAETLQETRQEVALTYALALLIVFLVLAAQFESLASAAVVMLTVPFGLAAAVFALAITGTSINIYSQIGLILLIGLMAKNGILIVEFANQLRDEGQSVYDAALGSARIRLRPVAMTILATVFSGLPLILGSGAGAESRAAIGWVVFGGLSLAAVFTLYLTPGLYILLARYRKPIAQLDQAVNNNTSSIAGSANK